MKIAFAIRPNYLANKGGDTFQFLKTKEYLERDFGCDVTIITSPDDLKSNQFDLMHIFNLQTTDFSFHMVTEAKNLNIKVLLSPIIWDFRYSSYVNIFSRFSCNFNFLSHCHGLSFFLKLLYGKRRYVIWQDILKQCDGLLPNSDEEGFILKERFLFHAPVYIVPNCIDPLINEDKSQYSFPANIVLQVGRIEPTKNQLAVLLAMMNHPEIPLYFVGAQNSRKNHYIKYLKQLAKKRGNTFFISDLSQSQLVSFYKAAKVHVLPSFRESPGLVTLEALFYHTNVVVSDKRFCPVSYYQFDKYGFVCDPFSVRSLEKAIMTAYNHNIVDVPADYFNFFNYKNAAKLTYDAYCNVLQ